MQDQVGNRVVSTRNAWHGRRVCRWSPLRGERWLRILLPRAWWLVQWLPREGWWITSAGEAGTPYDVPTYSSPRYQSDRMKRRQAAEPGKAVVQALPSTSLHWPKLPTIREFITATSYDDGSARQPGYLTVRNRVTTMEVTLYDPDSASRMVCRGSSLDEALILAEKLLGVEEAPWEPDNYLQQQLTRKPRRKSS